MRTSKAVAVLDKREAALRFDLQLAQAHCASIEAAINEVAGLRKEMTALPKRTSRAKRTQAVLAASVAGDSKATAA